MGEWALWAESEEQAENGPEDGDNGPAADVDETLESRRLRRWLKSMFGTPRLPEDDV